MRCPHCSTQDIDRHSVCPECGKSLSKSTQKNPQRTTKATTNKVIGFMFGLGHTVRSTSTIAFFGAVILLFGIPFVGKVLLAIAVLGTVIGSFIYMNNYRLGACPYCGINVEGIVRDGLIQCRTCKKNIAVRGETFCSI